MPLPRKKDDGTSGAPVLDILNARVRLTDVVEHTEPYTVTRKSDRRTFTLDPAFNCTVEVVDDGQGGDDNGTTFFEAFKYKNTEKDKSGEWCATPGCTGPCRPWNSGGMPLTDLPS